MQQSSGNPSGIVGSAAAGALGIDAYGMGQNEFNQQQQQYYQTLGGVTASSQVMAGTNSAIAELQPQATANYSALNQYFNLLGIPVPTGGFQALGQAQQSLASLQNGYQSAIASYGEAQGALSNPGLRLSSQQTKDYQAMAAAALSQASSLQSQIAVAQAQVTNLQNSGGSSDANSKAMQDQLAATPGYQFALNQGLLGAQQSAANNGLLNSGSALRGAETYAEGLAAQTYQNAVQNAAGAYNNTNGAQAAIANLYSGQGNSLGSITNNMYTNVANSYNQLSQLNNPLIQQAASIAAGSGAAQAGIASSGNAQNTALSLAGMLGTGNTINSQAGLLSSGFGGGV